MCRNSSFIPPWVQVRVQINKLFLVPKLIVACLVACSEMAEILASQVKLLCAFLSETEGEVIEKVGKEQGCHNASAYNGLFQSGTRVAGTRSLGFAVMSAHWSMHTFLVTNFSYQLYITFNSLSAFQDF